MEVSKLNPINPNNTRNPPVQELERDIKLIRHRRILHLKYLPNPPPTRITRVQRPLGLAIKLDPDKPRRMVIKIRPEPQLIRHTRLHGKHGRRKPRADDRVLRVSIIQQPGLKGVRSRVGCCRCDADASVSV